MNALTVSYRSTEDDYTPHSQIETIQDLVVGTLQDIYGSLHIHYHYLNTNTRQTSWWDSQNNMGA